MSTLKFSDYYNSSDYTIVSSAYGAAERRLLDVFMNIKAFDDDIDETEKYIQKVLDAAEEHVSKVSHLLDRTPEAKKRIPVHLRAHKEEITVFQPILVAAYYIDNAAVTIKECHEENTKDIMPFEIVSELITLDENDFLVSH